MTQRQIAEALDVTVSSVSMWEGGSHQTRPSLHHLEKLVGVLGLTMSQFYGRVPRAKAS